MSILIDNDGVIADSHGFFVKRWHDYGYNVSKDDINNWSFGVFRKKIGLSINEVIDDFLEMWKTDYEKIGPMDEFAVDVVNYILKTYDSAIVTANNLDIVKPWFEMQGINTKYLIENWKDKGKLNYNIFIEDNPNLVVPENKIIFMRNNPWNKVPEKGGEPAERFSDFSYIPGLIKKYERLVSKR